MLDIQLHGDLKVRFPHFDGLLGQSVHQVDADVVESRFLAVLHGINRLSGIVPAAQEAEFIIIETLYADTQAVDRQRGEHRDIFRCQIIRIGF